jgi:deoxyribodipyrimidine photo-lyase
MTPSLHPTRAAGLERLAAFVPKAGRAYAATRNIDPGPGAPTGVSGLSPYLRHRLITEQEVVAAVLAGHGLRAADKFIQEVCWRTYWKGWLEQRPQVWAQYLRELDACRTRLRDDAGLAADVAAAMAGQTGIDAFDAWARELASTGTLHNHARMWFASIWIFTLRLPWVLGADFFLRHLIDGDPASNTLSWRWVAGLHTRGKTYLARPDNIATYTQGRFHPSPAQLAPVAEPLADDGPFERQPLRRANPPPPGCRVVLLVTPDDMTPELWPLDGVDLRGIALAPLTETGPNVAAGVASFRVAALADVAARVRSRWGVPVAMVADGGELAAFLHRCEATALLGPVLPVGYWRSEIDDWLSELASAGVACTTVQARWDAVFWPHARAGFFPFGQKVPDLLHELGLLP